MEKNIKYILYHFTLIGYLSQISLTSYSNWLVIKLKEQQS